MSHVFDRHRPRHIGSCRKNDGPTGPFSAPPVCPRTRRETMAVTSSRRDILQFGGGTAAAVGVSVAASAFGPCPAAAQGATASTADDIFYRDDWFGELWRKPET